MTRLSLLLLLVPGHVGRGHLGGGPFVSQNRWQVGKTSTLGVTLKKLSFGTRTNTYHRSEIDDSIFLKYPLGCGHASAQNDAQTRMVLVREIHRFGAQQTAMNQLIYPNPGSSACIFLPKKCHLPTGGANESGLPRRNWCLVNSECLSIPVV